MFAVPLTSFAVPEPSAASLAVPEPSTASLDVLPPKRPLPPRPRLRPRRARRPTPRGLPRRTAVVFLFDYEDRMSSDAQEDRHRSTPSTVQPAQEERHRLTPNSRRLD